MGSDDDGPGCSGRFHMALGHGTLVDAMDDIDDIRGPAVGRRRCEFEGQLTPFNGSSGHGILCRFDDSTHRGVQVCLGGDDHALTGGRIEHHTATTGLNASVHFLGDHLAENRPDHLPQGGPRDRRCHVTTRRASSAASAACLTSASLPERYTRPVAPNIR
ncbi:unannotated protein [freshwater metagenome]|uniref:Unannotated protein n=1 Tax=freshwater metagenome TaxID=449393 RepID=A0A6J6U8V5_9ZZZZ